MVTLSRNTFRIAEMVKTSLPESLLVAGEPLPTLHPEQYCGSFDVVFRGEVDLSFPHFSKDYFDLGISRQQIRELRLESYAGLFIKRDGIQIENPTCHYHEKELETFPLPDRGDFDHAAYQEVWTQQTEAKTTSIMLTLGCPFSCDFCSRPIFGNCSGAGSSIGCSKRSSKSASWVMTACGLPTTTSRLIQSIWRNSAGG